MYLENILIKNQDLISNFNLFGSVLGEDVSSFSKEKELALFYLFRAKHISLIESSLVFTALISYRDNNEIKLDESISLYDVERELLILSTGKNALLEHQFLFFDESNNDEIFIDEYDVVSAIRNGSFKHPRTNVEVDRFKSLLSSVFIPTDKLKEIRAGNKVNAKNKKRTNDRVNRKKRTRASKLIRE
ncbi:hypothetical protein P7M07_02660 [Vibrio parahaemolyticus]|uniref:hypothetical protein n=1 Tax=Vibrio parahaemolyticus TaxID=670 RepID=UPI0004A815E3|nr:hypothetical protein [Vibrio parahaemolyticus]MDG2671891.1 hypothetical protein [Vibrio parahaemolyticus]HCE3033002.1 hypothetical protein [Vibrio parahaemolyticus]HCE3037252.1 hypothetical protein [Vibrio parahaemolyticus]HCG7347881.1 hypothetical protein [Vibrio parahaemolyticus]HCG7352125.1 hypothetical protein [Vibrio parahaemolyticus]